jgi:Ca2+-binding EF-hand superfamily protein
MKNLALLLLVISLITPTASFGAASQRMDATSTMAITDKNGDERIDREEYHQRLTEVFFFVDTDKDGNLIIAEIQVIEEVDLQRFKAVDRDGSQNLSIYEYHYALHKDFEAADKDEDGTLDMEELEIMMGS